MLLIIPLAYEGLSLYQGISLPFWIGFLAICFIAALLFFVQGKRLEMKSQKMMNLGWGIFFIFFALLRIFFMLGIFMGEPTATLEEYDLYTNIAYVVGLFGIICLLYVLEKYMTPQTKRIFLIITVAAFVICLVALVIPGGRDIALDVIYVLMPVAIGFIAIIYIYLIIKTTGALRKKCIWIFISLLIIVIGHLMDTQFFIGAFPTIPLFISPLIMSAGVIVFLISNFRIK